MLIGGILSTTISIHALLAECDQIKDIGDFFKVNFNPRTPCGVRLGFADGTPIEMGNFNPRTPCGVRPSTRSIISYLKYFNPRTPCGVRRTQGAADTILMLISIHALLAECDYGILLTLRLDLGFQSTHSLRSATQGLYSLAHLQPHFNPRTPCGVRRVRTDIRAGWYQISIHALLAECDIFKFVLKNAKTHFNPRTPCGVRPA